MRLPALTTARKRNLVLAVLVVLLGVSLGLGLSAYRSSVLSPPDQNQRKAGLEALTRYATSKVIDVSAIYVTEDFFRLTGSNPSALKMEPDRHYSFLVMVDTHIYRLPDYEDWVGSSELQVDGKGYPLVSHKLFQDSEHHQSIILQFPKYGGSGQGISGEDASSLKLIIRGMEGLDDERGMEWNLPLSIPDSPLPAFSILTLLPMLAGMLVILAPCAVHMSAYYMGLMGGVSAEEMALKRSGTKRNNRIIVSALFFVLGFIMIYSVLGMVIGYVGQFLKDTPAFSTSLRILTMLAGVVVMYFGLQVSGLFRIPFLLRLRLPYIGSKKHGTGYVASFFSGLTVATGCLQCVGGALFASMLLYAGAQGSLVQGGLTLLAFSLGIAVPYLLVALGHSRWGVNIAPPLKLTRYVPIASGVVLISLGMIMLSGFEGVVENFIFHIMGFQGL